MHPLNLSLTVMLLVLFFDVLTGVSDYCDFLAGSYFSLSSQVGYPILHSRFAYQWYVNGQPRTSGKPACQLKQGYYGLHKIFLIPLITPPVNYGKVVNLLFMTLHSTSVSSLPKDNNGFYIASGKGNMNISPCQCLPKQGKIIMNPHLLSRSTLMV